MLVEDLKKVQLAQLDLLLEFDRICRLHNINYYLIGGSALGAVRHSGFIPWDEDIDVGMYSRDFEHFLEVCNRELNEEYFLQSFETDLAYTGQFAKIRVNNTTFLEVEPSDANPKMHHGIFIDIFPLDNISDNNLFARFQYALVRFLVSVCLARNNSPKNPFKRLLKKVYCIPLNSLFSKAKMDELCKKIASWYNEKGTKRVTNFFGRYGFNRETLPIEWLGNPSYREFEGHLFPLPERWHEYLTHLYGDYLELPPESQRGTHEIFLVDFKNSFQQLIKTKGVKE